ncbi:MAG: HEAT repeat domain-containing protein [Parachlamydiales bacterium]
MAAIRLALLLLAATTLSALSEPSEGQILFLMQAGQAEKGVTTYLESVGEEHDVDLLRNMAYAVLEAGYGTQNPEEQLLALFGASITGQARVLPLLRNTLNSVHPEVQAATVGLLAGLDHDEADELLLKAMSSPYPTTRLEASLQLALKHHPDAPLHIESLMVKLPPQVHPLFPQLFAIVGNPEADRTLRRMLADPHPLMEIATIDSLVKTGRDDFLPEIRSLARRTDPLLQEACAIAFGKLKDTSALPQLRPLMRSPNETVRIAALLSAHRLGEEGAKGELERLALQENPYAITALGEVDGSQPTLASLLASRDLTIRLNAAMALLQHKDERATLALPDLLLTDGRDLGFMVQRTPSGALPALKIVPSMHAHLKDFPPLEEMTLSLKEMALEQVFALSEETRLMVARGLFRHGEQPLIPHLVRLLENAKTPGALALLKLQAETAGAPLIRTYCNLALFRAGEKGPYRERVTEWVERQQKIALIQLKPPPSWEERLKSASPYTLAPEQTSRLLLESFEALALKRDTTAINSILEALARGNPHNRYALAGLLLRVLE